MKDESEITADILLRAYASGVFPMAEASDDPEIYWVDPESRGIIPMDGFHISRSLARRMRSGGFDITLNRDFDAVVSACADRDETWINDKIFLLYSQLHRKGHAHSMEIQIDGQLVGGVYGVALGAAFFGESMFSRQTDASKIALAFLVDHLRETGFTLFDTQFITPHLASLGAKEITRQEYRTRLANALRRRADFLSVSEVPSAQDVIQRNNQMS